LPDDPWNIDFRRVSNPDTNDNEHHPRRHILMADGPFKFFVDSATQTFRKELLFRKTDGPLLTMKMEGFQRTTQPIEIVRPNRV